MPTVASFSESQVVALCAILDADTDRQIGDLLRGLAIDDPSAGIC